ncbi:shikimate kinase [Flavobacteriaceae bacterium F08102]|nr:shikimate kinase [Flavobacteriaceae bacterium F08102]
MKVVLVGYMGSGKSTIGQRLAKQLVLPFIDLDHYIEEKEGMSISSLFQEKGEIYFRKLETLCIAELLERKDDFVLALGGGTPCFGKNMELINAGASSFYLDGSLQHLHTRLSKPKRKNKRPLIKNIPQDQLKEFLAKHLFERRPFYEKATYQIRIDEKSKQELVEEIIQQLGAA